jgi:hypothetical protein
MRSPLSRLHIRPTQRARSADLAPSFCADDPTGEVRTQRATWRDGERTRS